MSVTYGFYNSVNHDRQYDAIQVSSIFDGIIKDGIFESIGDQLEVSANSGMTITVGSGRAWFNHTWTLNDALLPLTVTQAEVVLDRIDSVILEVNADEMVRTNTIKMLDGTPSSTPVPPTLTNTEDVHQYRLADIAVGAGVTEITQAEITNYIGTTDTPFITGILETMNVDMLVAQWQSEYQQMKNTDHIQYQGSLNADHLAYETQRTADEALFNAWFQNKMNEVLAWYGNLQVQIDENAAVHLQNQIGTLSLLKTTTKANLVAAINEVVGTSYPCYIRVSCAEEFAGHEVELSYGGSVINTALIPISAPYTVEFAVKETGQYTIRETVYDVSTTVNVTDYTIYNTGLYLGSITLYIDEDFLGSVITCTDGTTTKTWTCDSLTHVFSVGLGTWTISGIAYETEYSTSVTVTEYINYNAELHTAEQFNYADWLEAAYLDPDDYNSLSDVLADESAIRQLFSVHNAVDYLVESCDTHLLDDVETIINNEYCAKWINARNYALDTMYANESIADVMDTADKYFYGQWGYDSTTETWGPVGAVPKMTSDTTPYGTVSVGVSPYSNVEFMSNSYYAFDNDESTFYHSNGDCINAYVRYKFVNPVCVKRIYVNAPMRPQGFGTCETFKIQCSNDGISWVDITDTITNTKEPMILDSDNDIYYLYCQLQPLSVTAGGNSNVVNELQFYGRQLDVSVPTMTSATTPSGTVFASENRSNMEAYKAFDNNISTYWYASIDQGSHIGYTFPSAKVVKKVYARGSGTASSYPFTIQGSNDGTNWTDLSNLKEFTPSVCELEIELNNKTAYTHYRLAFNVKRGSYIGELDITTLQFYGFDYSESVEYDIYSAASDTVYYYPGGDTSASPVVLCTTDNTGHGKANMPLDEGTSITLYSTVAKDTENGTNSYSKNISLTNGDTIYLMPDKALYWYGYMHNNDGIVGNAYWTATNTGGTYPNEPRFMTNYVSLSAATITGRNNYYEIWSENEYSSDDYTKLCMHSTKEYITKVDLNQDGQNYKVGVFSYYSFDGTTIWLNSATMKHGNNTIKIWNDFSIIVYALWLE